MNRQIVKERNRVKKKEREKSNAKFDGKYIAKFLNNMKNKRPKIKCK